MAMKPEFQQEANWDPALTALPILEAPGFRVDSWRFEPATFPLYAFDPGAMRVLEILRESGVIRCAFYLFIRQPHGSEVSPAVPWCINTGKSLIPLTLRFLAQKRNLLIPLELSRVMHQGTVGTT